MQRTLFSRKRALLFIVIILFTAGITYYFIEAHNDTELSFQAYAPTVLPSGIHLTSHTTYVYSGEGEHYKEVSLLTNASSFGIGEEKSTLQQFQATTFSCATKMTNGTCVTLTSSKGQSYDIQTVLDDHSKVTTKTVSWHRGNTRFWISLSEQLRSNPVGSWGPIIDSFQPVPYGFEHGKNVHFSGG